jgi:hypothetical protein
MRQWRQVSEAGLLSPELGLATVIEARHLVFWGQNALNPHFPSGGPQSQQGRALISKCGRFSRGLHPPFACILDLHPLKSKVLLQSVWQLKNPEGWEPWAGGLERGRTKRWVGIGRSGSLATNFGFSFYFLPSLNPWACHLTSQAFSSPIHGDENMTTEFGRNST